MLLATIEVHKMISILGWLSLVILVFFIVYRRVLKKLQQKDLQKEMYIVLHPIEKEPAYGLISIFIEVHKPVDVEVIVYSTTGSFSRVLENKTFKKGGNIIQLDTTELKNGFYFYQAKTNNQKTKKLMEVRN